MDRIFLTGAAGFVGSNVLRQLVAQRRTVAILLRETSDARRIADLLPQVRLVRGDLKDLKQVEAQLADFAPQAILHLAWGGVKGADRNDLTQIDNVGQTLALYRISRALECRKFVGLGSQAEYGPQPGIIREDAPTCPTTLYGATKLAAAQVLECASTLSGTPFAWLRLFSSYGPDDDPSWLIPYLIERLLKGERPQLTLGEQIWDYVHVHDVARGIICAMDSPAQGIFNLGSGHARPLRAIIELIRDAIDPTLELGFGEVPYRPDQVMHLQADVSALAAAANWQPLKGLEAGLNETVAWHRGRRA